MLQGEYRRRNMITTATQIMSGSASATTGGTDPTEARISLANDLKSLQRVFHVWTDVYHSYLRNTANGTAMAPLTTTFEDLRLTSTSPNLFKNNIYEW